MTAHAFTNDILFVALMVTITAGLFIFERKTRGDE